MKISSVRSFRPNTSSQVPDVLKLLCFQAESVSGFVQHAIRIALDDLTGWGVTLAQALDETGGAMTPEERAWADRVLGISETEPGTAA